ncbi:hypothetical protein DVH05_013749 [Phytophthora capsici]|nr:hypothetical protein DVH05_013749 [Phytophthora capsici]
MAYCGSVGSVNVLTIMSTDLFDESQENPFLLQQRSPSPSKQAFDRPRSPQRAVEFNKAAELPLGDSSGYNYQDAFSPTKFLPHSQPVSPQYSPGRTVSFAAPNSVPRSILKRNSSYESDLSTVSSFNDQQQTQQAMNPVVTDSELHKLLYSLTRFGLANDAGTASESKEQIDQSNPLWFRGVANGDAHNSVAETQRTCDGVEDQHASMTNDRRSSKRKSSVFRQDPMGRSRGSVSFGTVKNLLRGGGLAGRTAMKNTPDVQRKKSMGTISSRLKINQKFVRPTIHTDAYHRVYVFPS